MNLIHSHFITKRKPNISNTYSIMEFYKTHLNYVQSLISKETNINSFGILQKESAVKVLNFLKEF